MKLYVREKGSADVRSNVEAAERVSCSRVAYPEARAALARKRREKAFGTALYARAVTALDRDFGRLIIVELSEEVAAAAGELAERHGLRGFDAIHLASAVELQAVTDAAVMFLCFDQRLRDAASAIGLTV